jgi:hypothetical protein
MRSYIRFETDQLIECRIGRKRETVTLYNLSCGGCMIETASTAAEVDERVTVLVTDGTSIPGRIVWRIEKNAGIKFEIPLHHKLVERLGFAEEEEFDRNDPRDRFGIPLVGYAHAGAGSIG